MCLPGGNGIRRIVCFLCNDPYAGTHEIKVIRIGLLKFGMVRRRCFAAFAVLGSDGISVDLLFAILKKQQSVVKTVATGLDEGHCLAPG